ncbi:MAG: stage III sporulation protein AE [Oscillospiraceae bacterium]|nr:stage III sporulation protein AE [Oscillospiraceae bacterium]
MKRILMLLFLVVLITVPVKAEEFTAPPVEGSAQDLLPEESTSFGEDIWYIFKEAISNLRPDITQAAGICAGLISVVMVCSVFGCYKPMAEKTVRLASTICIAVLLIKPSNTFIQLGVSTINQLCEYGKLFLPVMTTALAAEGGITSATGLYAGTVVFNTLLSTGITKLIVPMIYIFLVLCIAEGATGENVLKNLKDFIKWLMTWSLKISLYLFTGYLGITGVVSGTVDAASVKAAKLALSGFVPVVGGVMSDASEAILVSVRTMKNAAGVGGMLAFIAICITPFLKIALHYILLKLTAAVCAVLGDKASGKLIENFTSIMGILLAMAGTVCLLHIVSTVCFMKGVG